MTINLPRDLESSVRAEVLSGHFANEDDMVAAAVRAYLHQRHQEQLTAKPSGLGSIGALHEDELPGEAADRSMKNRHAEPSSQELQRLLLEAGIIREIKPPITDLTPYQNRQAIPVQGEPLSAAVIRERR
jgi:Arc/MetJ-type ribon-helix-helix transcriptional regulator